MATNMVILTGNLTKDLQLESVGAEGMQLTRLTIAQNRYVGSDREQVTDYFNVTVWGKLAENCVQWLKKGSKVLVSGKLQNRSYEANDGSKRYVTDIIASSVEFLDRPSEDKPKKEEPKETKEKPKVVEVQDELPF